MKICLYEKLMFIIINSECVILSKFLISLVESIRQCIIMIDSQRKKYFLVNLHIHNQLVQIPIRSVSAKVINTQIQQIVLKYNLKQKAIELIRKKIFQQINKLPENYLKNSMNLSTSATKSAEKSLNKKNLKYNNTSKSILQHKKKVRKQVSTKVLSKNKVISNEKTKKSLNSIKKQQKQRVIQSIIIDLRTPKLKDCDSQTEQKQNITSTQHLKQSLSNEDRECLSCRQKTDSNCLRSENQQSQNHQQQKIFSRKKNSKKQKIDVLSRLKTDKILSNKENILLYSQKQFIEQKNISQFNVNANNILIQQLQINSPIRQLQINSNNEYKEVTINQLYSQYQQFIKAQKLKKIIQDNEHKIKKIFQLLIQNAQTQSLQLSNSKKRLFRDQFAKLHLSLSTMSKQQIQNFNFNKFKQILVKNQCCHLIQSFIE